MAFFPDLQSCCTLLFSYLGSWVPYLLSISMMQSMYFVTDGNLCESSLLQLCAVHTETGSWETRTSFELEILPRVLIVSILIRSKPPLQQPFQHL